MRIITCTGYFSTGSSAIGDLLSEYKDFNWRSDYELRFIYDPDGLADLQYHLVDNHNRHNSGHAIKRYSKLVDFYKGNKIAPKNESFFNGKWVELSHKYINDLVEFSYKGAWLYDYLDKGVGYHYINSFLRKVFHKDLLCNELTLCSYPDNETFLKITRDYIEQLLIAANDKNTNNFVVDQVVPPSDIKRYMPLFNNIYVFIVDRDPRDVFFLEKYIRRGNVIPSDPETYCKWYEYTRRHRNIEECEAENIMLILFEDMIYNYDETIKQIENRLGINRLDHIHPKTKFIPERSINNTQIWRRLNLTEIQQNELSYIENNLRCYLYNFPKIEIKKTSHIE